MYITKCAYIYTDLSPPALLIVLSSITVRAVVTGGGGADGTGGGGADGTGGGGADGTGGGSISGSGSRSNVTGTVAGARFFFLFLG